MKMMKQVKKENANDIQFFYDIEQVQNQKQIRMNKSKVLFFYLTEYLQVTKLCTKRITRHDKSSNSLLLVTKSSTTFEFKIPIHDNKLPRIIERVSIVSSNAKV